MSSLADKIFQAKSSAVENAPKVWVFKPNDRNVCFEYEYPEFNRKALMAKWFPNNFECFQKYVKEGDIMEYFVIFFDAEEGGARNNCVELAKICGVPPTGNFVVMRKKWVGEEEKTIDMGFLPRDKGNQEGLSNFIKFCEGKLSLDMCLPQPRGYQKIDAFSKDSLEGNNKEKSLSNNMSSSKELVNQLSKQSVDDIMGQLDKLSQEECGQLLQAVHLLQSIDKGLSSDESIKLSGASAPPQKIDGFFKESLEGNNKEKSLNNMSSISEVKKSNIYASVCNPPCVPRSMFGTSWWKCLGYGSACGCAEVARLENRPPMPNAYPSRAMVGERMDISVVKSRNILGVFPSRYVDDNAEKAVRVKYLEYWIEFCKEEGVDASGGTMEIFSSAEDVASCYPNGLKNVVIAPLLSEVQEKEKGDKSRKFSVSCGHLSLDSEVKGDGNVNQYLDSDSVRDCVIGMAKMDIGEKWVEFSKHRLRCVKMSFADSDSPAVPAEKQCVFCGCDWGEYGNNAEPVAKGQCCDDCNRNVILKFRRESRKVKPEDECNGDCKVIGGCDCKAKNAEAVRQNKIVDIIGEQILASCVKVSGVVDMDSGFEVGVINKRISSAEVSELADVGKGGSWVGDAVNFVKAKGNVTLAEAVQGLDSFIFGLMIKSGVYDKYAQVAQRIKAEDAENARLQAIAEAELLKVIAEAKPEKKEKPKTAKQLEAEATRQANAEKKRADKAKAEYEAKSAIIQEANRKKAQDKQKAILKAKRANQLKLAEQALANQVGKSDK